METPFNKVAQAIYYMQAHVTEQPSLAEVAAHVGISPFHFQRMFTEWAGTSPKKFLQYLTLSYAKEKLLEHSILDTALDLGLSGSSRLHDLFINIEAMTPGEFKNGGKNLSIHYGFAETRFGSILMASTTKGICHLSFYTDAETAISELQQQFPKASFKETIDDMQKNILCFFRQDWSSLQLLRLHLKGTIFQLKVWETLLKIPNGKLTTYGAISEHIKHPKSARAVGSAVGANPIAYLIPCHRVIQASGVLGGYRWDETRKSAMIGWEAVCHENTAIHVHLLKG